MNATADFDAFRLRREQERAALDESYISWRKAELPGALPSDPKGFVARNGHVRAYVQPRGRAAYEVGLLVTVPVPALVKTETRRTLHEAKAAAFRLVSELSATDQTPKKEEVMSTATAEPKVGSKQKKATKVAARENGMVELRAALVAAIREAVPGAKPEWNGTHRYQTFRLDGRPFGLVFEAGAKTVPVKIPAALRDVRIAPSASFKKSEYGLMRSISKPSDVKVVAKAFAAAAAATKTDA